MGVGKCGNERDERVWKRHERGKLKKLNEKIGKGRCGKTIIRVKAGRRWKWMGLKR